MTSVFLTIAILFGSAPDLAPTWLLRAMIPKPPVAKKRVGPSILELLKYSDSERIAYFVSDEFRRHQQQGMEECSETERVLKAVDDYMRRLEEARKTVLKKKESRTKE